MTNQRETRSTRVVNLSAVVDEVQVAGESRTLTGVIASIGIPSTSQRVVLQAGSLRARQPLDRVKLLRDHNTTDPVGYLRALSTDGLTATFFVPEGPNGDRALAEAQNGLRNGLSVGFHSRDAFEDRDGNLQIPTAEMYEVSLVAVPDMQDAQVTSVVMAINPREEPMTEQLPESTPVEDRDVELATTPSSVELSTAGPTPLPPSLPLARTTPRRLSVHDVALRIVNAGNDLTGSQMQRLSSVALAIQDILPAQDVGTGWIGRADWAGELWSASQYTRPWIDSLGAPAELTSAKRAGWRWKTKPTVDEYAGGKTEVPSSNYLTEADEYNAFRIAAGWDIDRIFEDLPTDPGFIEAFWAAATDEYKAKSDAAIRSRIIAIATANDKTSSTAGGNTATVVGTTITQLLKQINRDGRNVKGSKINRIWLDNVLFSELEDLPTGGTNGLPLWLAGANIGVDITEGTANVGELYIQNDPTLAPRTAIYYDTRALKVREKAPFQVKGLDIAHGGIDLGLYSYLMLEDQDPRLIMRRVRPTS